MRSLLLMIACIMTTQDGIRVSDVLERAVEQSRITEPGSAPFHLKATATPAHAQGGNRTAEIEEYWVSPDKWRRTIHSSDFQQTVIVNGGRRFESNSGDYVPKWLTDLCTALFDVVPPYFVEEVRSLGERQPATDVNTLGTEFRFERTSSDGQGSITAWGVASFERGAGLLTFALGTGFAAGYKEHKPFHGKLAPRLVETFPLDPDGDELTRIAEVSDLKDPDESLFTIPEPTPLEKQIRTVRVTEQEYRKLAVNPPVMKWPKVDVRPASGTLTTYIVTDRTGKVRECEFGISNNMRLKDGACDLVKQWRFKPFLLDGVPVQVEAPMTFAFNTEMVGEQAKFEAASYYFKRGRDLTFPRTGGSAPFHMRGTFQGEGSLARYSGEYEEWWFSPDHWRRHLILDNVVLMESRIDDDLYGPAANARITDRNLAALWLKATGLFTADFPGYAYFSPDTDWHMADVSFENVPALRVSMGPTEGLPEGHYPRAYYFESDGRVHAATQSNEVTLYEDFAGFEGKQVPRGITYRVDGATVLKAHIALIEKTEPREDTFLEIRGVKPRDSPQAAPR